MQTLTIFITILGLPIMGTINNVTAPRQIAACHKPGEWIGGSVDTELSKSSKGSIRWSHAESDALRLASPPANWDTHNTIRFWMHNQVKTDSAIMLIIRSENPKTEGMDYWMSRIKLNFEGWQEINIPRGTMGWARQPLGWDQITEVFFAASGWDNEPDPRAVIHIDQLQLVEIPLDTGPRTTDEMLFQLLNLDYSGLEKVRAAVEESDLKSAKERLIDYLRNRTTVPWRFDPHNIDRNIRYSKSSADQTVAGKVRISSIWHTFPDGDIDWFYNPTIERDDLFVDHEWQWQLGRMGYWGNLGRAYWGTGDEAYAQAFVKQLRSWVKQCPRPSDSGNYAGSAWRTIECGIRMGGSWPDAYHRFLHSPSFTDEDVILYVKSCIEQAQHLRKNPTSGNWLTMEMSGLYYVGALFPELKDASEWRSYAINQIYEELNKQFLPDGAQVELTPGYHQVALSNILKIPELARRVGRFDELPDDFVARTERAFEYNLYLMTPDRDMPRLNDSWHVNVPGTMRDAIELFPDRQDFRWIATDGKEGVLPAEVSHPFPYAGYYVMRSGWDRGANYLCFDAGPLGYGHVHQDKLSVLLWPYGREMLFDGGGGSYERSQWRSYDTNTFSHNTVLVDGLAQRRQTRNRWANVSSQPIDVRWESTDTYDFAVGVYDKGYGKEEHRPAIHIRRVLFVKPDMFLIVDALIPSDNAEHTYQARWHLMTTSTQFDEKTSIVATIDTGLPNLALVPLATEGLTVRVASAQTTPELLGWWVQKSKTNKPVTTVTHTRRGTGTQHFLTLLLPIQADSDNPVQEVSSISLGKYKVNLADGRKISLMVDPDPHGNIDVHEVLPDGGRGREISVR